MTVNDGGFCDAECDDCGAEIDAGEWHVHTHDGESKCMDCADSSAAPGPTIDMQNDEVIARHPKSFEPE